MRGYSGNHSRNSTLSSRGDRGTERRDNGGRDSDTIRTRKSRTRSSDGFRVGGRLRRVRSTRAAGNSRWPQKLGVLPEHCVSWRVKLEDNRNSFLPGSCCGQGLSVTNDFKRLKFHNFYPVTTEAGLCPRSSK